MFAFVEKFFLISSWESVLALCVLVSIFVLLWILSRKGVGFYKRMGVALCFGLVIGVFMQWALGFDGLDSISAQGNDELQWIVEFDAYLNFLISIFMKILRLLVIPMVFVGIIHALISIQSDVKVGSLLALCLFWLMLTTAIAALIGIVLGLSTHLGFSSSVELSKTLGIIKPFPEMILALVPSNIITAMNTNNIMGVVIFAFLVGFSARYVGQSTQENFAVFKGFVNICYEIVIKLALFILQAMPYAIVAMIAHTLIASGFGILAEALHFIILVFVAMILLFGVHCGVIALHGLNPFIYLKKAFPVLMMAFASRSSAGTLPLTISTLTQKLGVSPSTASCVGSIGTTMGMNGCAGYYAGLVAIFVYNALHLSVGFGDIVMIVLLCVIASFGIAGIPGVTIMIISVMLTGLGLESHFALLGVILAIDPILDMARTCSNVSGAMVASIASDKRLGNLDQSVYRAKI